MKKPKKYITIQINLSQEELLLFRRQLANESVQRGQYVHMADKVADFIRDYLKKPVK